MQFYLKNNLKKIAKKVQIKIFIFIQKNLIVMFKSQVCNFRKDSLQMLSL